MPKSYWTKIQTPNGLKYFRADDVTDELLQKIKDEAGGLFIAKYQETNPADVFAAIDLGKTVYVSLSTQGTGPFLQTYVISKDAQLSTTYARFTGIFEYDGVIREYAVECNSAGWGLVTDIPLAVQSNLAPAYDSLQTYAVDDIVHRDSELYRCTTAIDTPEHWTPAHWTQTTVAAELGKTFFATVFTTPYSEIKAAYDAGRSIIAVDGHSFYHMFDYNESAGHECFRFSLVSGDTFLLYTCNKTGYDGTHGWNPQVDFVSCAQESDIAPRYSSESTYDVGDLAYNGGLLYRCTTAISTPEIWNPNHWTRTDMDTELGLIDSPTNVSQGFGVAEATLGTSPAFTATLAGYTLDSGNGGIVCVKFINDVPSSATLDINGTGVKAIYYNGSAIAAGTIQNGDRAFLAYDGTNYVLMGVDRSVIEMTDTEITDLIDSLS